MSASLALTASTHGRSARETLHHRSSVTHPPRFRSEDLLRGQREVLIEHDGVEYRLRHTRLGKLILTK